MIAGVRRDPYYVNPKGESLKPSYWLAAFQEGKH